MPLKVKICGLTTPETIDAAISAGARYVGYNFFPPSPRYLSFDAARGLAARTPPHVLKVGVFVDPSNALIAQAVDAAALDIIQLHECAPGRAAEIASWTALETWAAVPVRTSTDLNRAFMYRDAVTRLLYDAKLPDSAVLPGGMGVRFDWRLLSGFAHPLPWGLAGGLSLENLAEAARITNAPLLDVSSGVERAPGVKDVDKIAAFLKAASQL